jgi:hypothetical protein
MAEEMVETEAQQQVGEAAAEAQAVTLETVVTLIRYLVPLVQVAVVVAEPATQQRTQMIIKERAAAEAA